MKTATKNNGKPKVNRRGRPPELVMPPPIPDTPENIARACFQGPPKKEWEYLKSGAARKAERRAS